MNTDKPGGSRFEERLLTAILDDFDQLTGAAAPPRPARSRAAAPALIAIAATAVAAAVVVVFGQSQARTPAPPASPTTTPFVRTAAYVMTHLRSALSINSDIVHVISRAPDSQTGKPVTEEIWSTSLSKTYRITDLSPDGRPVTGYLVTITAHRTVSIVIDYQTATWTKATCPFGSASNAGRPGPAPETPLHLAAQLRAQVKAGKVTLIGSATVDGQRAIHLVQRSAAGTISLWVSPASYLPIREIDTAPGMSQSSPGAIREDYRWLPARPANLRLLSIAAAIPSGFSPAPANGHCS